MQAWLMEIEELHAVFESYFLGTNSSLERVEAALAPDFTIVGPDGNTANREQTVRALVAGHAHTTSLVITITEPQLLFEDGDVIVASYVENHQLSDRSNHRLSTVIFSRYEKAPRELLWRRVHETWR